MSTDSKQLEICSSCGLPPQPGQKLRRCTRCYTVAYHDDHCQSEHYPIHRETCRRSGCAACGYKVVDMDGKGKSVMATRNVGQGELLQATDHCGFRPLVPPVLFASARGSHCTVCFHKRDKNSLCLSQHRKFKAYACAKCAASLPYKLKDEIVAITTLLGQADSRPEGRNVQIFPTALLTYRLLVHLQDGTLEWDTIERMQTHDNPSKPIEHTFAVQWIVWQLVLLGDQVISSSLVDRVVPIVNRIQYNAFTISDDQGDSIGFGLYKSPAHRFNHSCEPNAAQSFDDDLRLDIVALRPINPGEEISLSYIDTSLDAKKRRKQLLDGYNFHCCCTLCVRQEES